MNNSSRLAAWLILACALPASAGKMEDTVAVVNQQPILLSEYQKELSTAMDYWSKTEPDALKDPANLKKLKETTLEELINRELLYQEGVKEKIKVRERDIDNGVNEIKTRFLPQDANKDAPDADAQAQEEENFRKQLESDGLSYEQFRDRLSKQIMARKLIDQEVRSKVKPPEENEIHDYFVKLRDYLASTTAAQDASTSTLKGMDDDESQAFRQMASQIRAMSSERVRVSRILIKVSPNASENEKRRALKTAEDVRAQLQSGTSSFAEIARAESEDPDSASRGGDIGYVLRGVAPPDFEKAAFSLDVGEISQPIFTEIGYNIIRVDEKRASEPPEYDRFKDEVGKFLENLEFQKELEKYVKSLKETAVIDRNLSSL